MLSIWEYRENKRNYPGFHIAGNDSGIDNIARKLKSIKANKIAILLSPVTNKMLKAPNNKAGKAKIKSYSRLVIEQSMAKNDIFTITGKDHGIMIKASRKRINEIAKSLIGTKRGDGDYCIGAPKTGLLWFWWIPK